MREACMIRLSHTYSVHLVPGVSQNEVPHGAYFTKQDSHVQGEYIVTCSWKCNSRVSYREWNWKVFWLTYTNYLPYFAGGRFLFSFDMPFLLWLSDPWKRERPKKWGGRGKGTPSHFCYPKSKWSRIVHRREISKSQWDC